MIGSGPQGGGEDGAPREVPWEGTESKLDTPEGRDVAQVRQVTLSDATERTPAGQALADRERHLQMLMEGSLEGFWLSDLQARFLDVNQAYCALSGYSRDELLRLRIPDVEALETEQDNAAHIARIVSQGADRFETQHRRKDGQIIDVEMHVTYLGAGGGRIFCFCRDITDRKRAERELRESEQKLRALFGAMTDVIFILDGDGRYLEVAPSNPVHLVRPATELLGRRTHEVLPATQADLILRQIRCALETQQTTSVDYELEIDGAPVWFAGRISPMSANTVLLVARDISERKQAEEALRQSEARYRALFEHAPVAIFKTTSEDRLLFVNPAGARIFGYDSPEQYVSYANEVGVARASYWDPAERPRMVRQIVPSDGWQHYEAHYRRRDGSEMFCNEWLAAQVEGDGKTYLTGFIEDITESKRAQAELHRAALAKDGMLRALQASEARFRTLIEQAPIPILLTRNGRIVYANGEWLRLGGRQDAADVVGRPVVEYMLAPSARGLGGTHGRPGRRQP